MSAHIELVELGPIRAATVLWRPHGGKPVLTIVCKATYGLGKGVVQLAEAQDDVNQRDLHAENNPKLGLHSASDMAPFKSCADVTVVGRCFAPPRELSRMLVARVRVGTVDKRLEVHAERFLMPDGKVLAEKFFSKMAIGYERAPGGAGTANPVGLSLAAKDAEGRVPLPNVQAPGEVPRPQGSLTPVGFGPIPQTWPTRAARAKGRGVEFLDSDPLAGEIPADMDWGYFNVAPRDQQLDEIAADQAIWLEHLHPEEPQLEMRLPGIYPCVYTESADEAHRVQMKGDTLWIDTNRLVLTLTWRAQVPLESATQSTRVLVSLGEPGHKPSWDTVWAQAEAKRRRVQRVVAPTRPEAPASRRGPDAVPPSRRDPGSMTSPVPLVPGNDHTPGWVPVAAVPQPSGSNPGVGSVPPGGTPHPPDSGGRAPGVSDSTTLVDGSSVVIELPLDVEEVRMLRALCNVTGQDAVEMIRRVLRAAHHHRFG